MSAETSIEENLQHGEAVYNGIEEAGRLSTCSACPSNSRNSHGWLTCWSARIQWPGAAGRSALACCAPAPETPRSWTRPALHGSNKPCFYEFNRITPCEDSVWRHWQVFGGAVQRWGRERARLELGFGMLALNESILIRKSAEHFAIDGKLAPAARCCRAMSRRSDG